MDCFHDFCLACDRESTSGLYCSQACRLADLEKASSPSSPTSPAFPHNQSSWASSRSGTGSGYILAPAYKFPDRAPSYSQPTAGEEKRPQSSYFMRSSPKESPRSSHERQRSLTPSSSRSSLSSNMSSSNSTTISEQAKQELQEYFNAFDQTRSAKRRQSSW